MSAFEILNGINVNDKTEEKNGLTYLSWAWAWAEVKKQFPDAQYTVYERQGEYGNVNYFTDGRTCWVKTGVVIDGIEHIEMLPVMDYKNRSIPFDNVTSTDVNKAIQRSLTKACARHGLGLYIYAGEDLPEGDAGNDTTSLDGAQKTYGDAPLTDYERKYITTRLTELYGDKAKDKLKEYGYESTKDIERADYKALRDKIEEDALPWK